MQNIEGFYSLHHFLMSVPWGKGHMNGFEPVMLHICHCGPHNKPLTAHI